MGSILCMTQEIFPKIEFHMLFARSWIWEYWWCEYHLFADANLGPSFSDGMTLYLLLD